MLASRIRGRERVDPLVTIAGEVGAMRARVDEHERRLRRIERERRNP